MKLVRYLLGATLLFSSCAQLFAQDAEENSHVAIENPAKLTHDEANTIYDSLKEILSESYGLAELSEIKDYQNWERYNSAPYISVTHGKRFVNNYANELGKDYGKLAEGEQYPAGTVFAKDSITVTDEGKNFMGAMFVMEKLESGKNTETGDWRYIMVLPDGTQYGDTTGDDPELVKYCHTCHVGVASKDYVFFIPKNYRID